MKKDQNIILLVSMACLVNIRFLGSRNTLPGRVNFVNNAIETASLDSLEKADLYNVY